MPTANINTGKKTCGEFTIGYQRAGYGGCIPTIDGEPQPALTFGYVSDRDRDACLEVIRNAVNATNGDISAAINYIRTAIQTAADDIHPDEAVDVDGMEVLISYETRKAYYYSRELANLDDLECFLPHEAIKAMLIDRVRIVMADEAREEFETPEWGSDDDEFDY